MRKSSGLKEASSYTERTSTAYINIGILFIPNFSPQYKHTEFFCNTCIIPQNLKSRITLKQHKSSWKEDLASSSEIWKKLKYLSSIWNEWCVNFVIKRFPARWTLLNIGIIFMVLTTITVALCVWKYSGKSTIEKSCQKITKITFHRFWNEVKS